MNRKACNTELCTKKVAVIFPKDSESVFTNTRLTFGGATVQLYNISRELVKTVDITAIVNRSEKIDPDKQTEFPVVLSYGRQDSLIRKILIFHRSLRKVRPDVVIQRGLSYFSPLLCIYCRIFRIKFIFMYAHDRESRGRFQRTNRRNLIYPLLLRCSSSLVVQNDQQEKSIPSRFSDKIHKIRNGFEMSRNGSCDKCGVLWVGRLEPWKRPEAFIRLAEKFPDVPFIMICPGVGGYEKFAEKVYTDAAEVDNIKIIDFVPYDEIDENFKKAKIFVNTSLEEGFPNTFVQACRNNTPIVSLSVNPDSFIDRYGLGCTCGDSEDVMYQSVKGLLTDDELYSEYSSAAYEYARENHSIRQNVMMLQKLF